jgi:hypothetical protein
VTLVPPKVILRLGSHAEKEYFLKTIDFWDGLIVGANLLEAAPGATASLILKFAGEKHQVPYYLDPMTYAFGTYVAGGITQTNLDWIKSDQKVKTETTDGQRISRVQRRYKRSYRKLANEFGGPIDAALKTDSGIATLDQTQIASLSAAVVQYQATRVRREFEDDPEYTDIASLVPPPAAAYAPYFYIDPNNADDGLELLSQCATTAVQVEVGLPIHAIFCTDVAALGMPSLLNRAASLIKGSRVAGVWLWFSRFYEEAASLEHLGNLRVFVEDLRETVDVFNMHGGYLSLAFSRFGLSGVSHGIGYGEQKDVIPVIGQSTPTVRYYLPDLRRRLGVPQIERALGDVGVRTAADFYNKICNCAICRGVIQTDVKQFSAFGDLHYSTEKSKRMAQTPAAARRCRFHFLLNRLRERNHVASCSASQIADDLHGVHDKWRNQPTIRGEVDHLQRWESILRA